jgi:hypothetical protein
MAFQAVSENAMCWRDEEAESTRKTSNLTPDGHEGWGGTAGVGGCETHDGGVGVTRSSDEGMEQTSSSGLCPAQNVSSVSSRPSCAMSGPS